MRIKTRPQYVHAPEDETGAAAPETPDAVAPLATPAPAAPAPEPEEIDLDSELTQDAFDRAYVEKLRKQAARYRTSHNEVESKYKALYDGFDDPTDLDFLADLGRRLYTDPASTAAEFESIAKRIREATGQTAPAAPEANEPAPEDKPLTRADLEAIERERALEAATKQIIAEAKSLGYADGTPEYAQLIWLANNDKECKGDLTKAHAKILGNIEAAQKAAVQAYIDSVKSGNSAFPALSAPGGGAPGPTGEAPKDWASASAAALERLSKAL